MTSKVTSEPLPTTCSYRNIVNLESKPSVPQELESFDVILSKAEKLTLEIDTILSSHKQPKDKSDFHRTTITAFWILTSMLSHFIYTTTNDLLTTLKSLEPKLYSRMEIDCIALNIICHELYDLSRLYLGLFRVLTVKMDKSQMNQLSRLFDLAIAKSESSQVYMCSYIDRLASAIGHDAEVHPTTAGANSALKNVGTFTRIMSLMKSMILMPPLRKFDAFTQTKTGQSLLEWLANTMRLVVHTASPPLIGEILETALSQLHPIDMLHRTLKPDPVNALPNTAEFVTLRPTSGNGVYGKRSTTGSML